MIVNDIIKQLETLASPVYQEEYDNCGLITGNIHQEVTGILISLDCIESIVEEAIRTRCNLIVAHHPIIFKGLKKINGNNYIERTIIKAIKHDVAIYAIHTNLDNVVGGVNFKIAEKLGLENVKILSSKKHFLKKLITYVPHEHKENLLQALYKVGAGKIGNYSECSYQLDGTGTFRPNEKATPTIGNANELETVEEKRIEVIFPTPLESSIICTLRQKHPYEEPAFDIILLENKNPEIGSGAIGDLPISMKEAEFMNFLKSRMALSCIRHTTFIGKEIKKVAVCGGSGSFLLKNALNTHADVYISADFKYHDFFDAENKIVIADIGHYESEVFTKDLIYDFLIKKFSNIAIRLAETDTNPISYI
ncbi:MAG TPA: Nif3-like dinuclear metal center hexameric protein [Cytophagaceae bacterium]|jgi:dinuclear metal center YbgI/SA1388 family protein|nr:Nif3-like dinuclear metal center hexameric protein [Cytophagaceae bacterium]